MKSNGEHPVSGQMLRTYTFVFLGYVAIVALFAFMVAHYQEQRQLESIDQRLYSAASGLKFMLADDFHDRAVDENSISLAEELKNRKAISQFAAQAGFIYAYTLVERDGKFYFSAPTVTEEEAKERERWYFYPYEDVPEEFVRAWRDGAVTFVSYADQWGSFRSVALPETSPGGKRYLACVDMDISTITRERVREATMAGGVALLLVLSSLPLLLLYRRSSSLYVSYLKRANAELARANKRLEAIDMIKSSLVNKVSHELRTPLTSILGFVKLSVRDFKRHFGPLAEGRNELTSRRRRLEENLDTVVAESERLTRLINDFLDLAKIESGKMEWRDIRLSPTAVATAALSSVRGELEDKQSVSLSMDAEVDLPEIIADPDKIHQLLINLLSNALKFTDSGSVTLVLSRQADYVRFEVRDSGIGIRPDELPIIFDEFHSSLSTDTVHDIRKGTGLGLAICRQIAEHYGGSISAMSELGKGSTFTVLIPALTTDN